MVKDSKAKGAPAKGNWRSGEGAGFRLIQPLDMTTIKTAIIRSPDRRIAGSPDRPTCVFVGSPPKPFSLPT